MAWLLPLLISWGPGLRHPTQLTASSLTACLLSPHCLAVSSSLMPCQLPRTAQASCELQRLASSHLQTPATTSRQLLCDCLLLLRLLGCSPRRQLRAPASGSWGCSLCPAC